MLVTIGLVYGLWGGEVVGQQAPGGAGAHPPWHLGRRPASRYNPGWLSILTRKLLRWGIFTSTDDLTRQVLAFIGYYNRTMAKPFKWTYQAKALAA